MKNPSFLMLKEQYRLYSGITLWIFQQLFEKTEENGTLITAEGLGDINSIPKTTSVVASVDLRSLEGQLADEYVSSIYSYASHAFK